MDRSDELYRRLAGLGSGGGGVRLSRVRVQRGGSRCGERSGRARWPIYDRTVKAYTGGGVLVYGFSLGTAMAAYVASERSGRMEVILAAPFATAEEEMPVFARRMGFLRPRRFALWCRVMTRGWRSTRLG